MVGSKKTLASSSNEGKSESKNKMYYKNYLSGLEDFITKESRSLTTLEYYNIGQEIEKIKNHITKI